MAFLTDQNTRNLNTLLRAGRKAYTTKKVKLRSTKLNSVCGSPPRSLPSLASVSLPSCRRAYPRLTAPDRGKTRLNAPNRAKNFSGGSRASIRACATNGTNLHQVALTCAKNEIARIARSCRKKIIIFQTPGLLCLRSESEPNLNPRNQTTPKLGHCRRSRNRPGLAPLNLNTSRSAGLPTAKSQSIPASLRHLSTAATLTAGPPHGFSALFCAVWCYLVLFGPNFYLALWSVLFVAFALKSA